MLTNAEQRIGLICIHVAEQGAPVCLIEHSVPLDDLDSGWGFYCGAAEHANDELRITDLEQFKALDPDIPSLLDTTPQERIVWRSSKDNPWIVESTKI